MCDVIVLRRQLVPPPGFENRGRVLWITPSEEPEIDPPPLDGEMAEDVVGTGSPKEEVWIPLAFRAPPPPSQPRSPVNVPEGSPVERLLVEPDCPSALGDFLGSTQETGNLSHHRADQAQVIWSPSASAK